MRLERNGTHCAFLFFFLRQRVFWPFKLEVAFPSCISQWAYLLTKGHNASEVALVNKAVLGNGKTKPSTQVVAELKARASAKVYHCPGKWALQQVQEENQSVSFGGGELRQECSILLRLAFTATVFLEEQTVQGKQRGFFLFKVTEVFVFFLCNLLHIQG